jgi:hypothetical protein
MLAAGRVIGEVCQALGISQATFQRCRQAIRRHSRHEVRPGHPLDSPERKAVDVFHTAIHVRGARRAEHHMADFPYEVAVEL